ncbi:tripartite tricarboxylate transporter permease [Bauldia sp.]|uniref:tripartite tricarboxylate transporter permease n=1 Tax=Bauldia sp. TaxID=2575872 RepID=UPI003BAB0E9E
MSGLSFFGDALLSLMTWQTLFDAAWATLLGIMIGSLPGLTATMGVALLTTLTYQMQPTQAILILICMYVGAIYGGSRSAILLNIPGTPANAATSLDGYPLAHSGRGGYAMGIATSASAIGTVIGILFLAVSAPLLSDLALDFGSFEFFWLALFGVIISGQLTAMGNPLKGYIAGILGLLVAMIGMEGIHAHVRFTFGIRDLQGGIGLIPAMVGAFGFAEVLTVMHRKRAEMVSTKFDRVLPRLRDLWRYKFTAARSGVIGTFVGIIPGVGEDIGAWASYAAAKRTSKEAKDFGKGSVEGLTAAETGNSAVVPGALIPLLTLAIPGSAPAAVLLAALYIHDVNPGPMIMINQPTFVYQIVAMLLIATIGITMFGLSLTKPLLTVLQIPRERLMPVVFVLCVVGPYAITQRFFDVLVVLFFGVVGFFLRRMGYPMAPLVLGIILGTLIDKNLRRGLTLTDGDPSPFFTRPISMIFCILVVLTILLSIGPVRRAAQGIGKRAWSIVARKS